MPSSFLDAFTKTIQPQLIDTFTPLGYTPHARQEAFHEMSRQRINAILFGGAASGGKSCALLMEAIHNAANYPGMRIACIRRTYNELGESFIAELIKRDYAKALGARWNESNYVLRFPNNSIINFTYAESEKDATRIQGGEYQLFCIDEATLMPPEVIQHIEERLRSGRRDLPVIGLRLASNPGGMGHRYVRERFIKPTNYGQSVITDEEDRSIAFIPSKYTDNPYVDKGYEKVLNSIADPQRRKAMRDGDWDASVGQFFQQLDRRKHLVPKAFDLPIEWTRFCGIDYGFRDPFAACWCAADNDGRLWFYRELYAKEVNAADQAKLILAVEHRDKDEVLSRAADPSMWGARGTPLSIADVYGLEGCGILKADNDRLNGWSRVHQYLNDAPACDYHRSDVEQDGITPKIPMDKCPMIHFFEDKVPMLIDTMFGLPRSDTKPEDAQTINVADHLPDALRYLCMSVGSTSAPVFNKSREHLSEEDIEALEAEERASYDPQAGRAPLVGGIFAGNTRMPRAY